MPPACQRPPNDCIRGPPVAKGVDTTDIDVQPWGTFTSFADPDGNRWHVQELPAG